MRRGNRVVGEASVEEVVGEAGVEEVGGVVGWLLVIPTSSC